MGDGEASASDGKKHTGPEHDVILMGAIRTGWYPTAYGSTRENDVM